MSHAEQDRSEWSEATACARGGWYPEFTTRPSAPALFQTTAFDLEGLEQLDAVAAGTEKGYIYTRDGNPNHEAFANDLALLEKTDAGVVCSSGMGAMTATLLAHVKGGEHVLAARVLYGRTSQLLNHLQSAFGVELSYFDATRPQEIAPLLKPKTQLCLVESISNPLMEVADLAAIKTELGDIPLLVDSTFTTPCLLRPVEHGAQLVFHSGSKYLNGHGDVMLGAVAGELSRVRKIRGMSALYGMNSNPFECWLASRGLRTLPLRMARVSSTAAELAEVLRRQPAVTRVYYPGLVDHPSHAVARKILTRGYGGMLSFELAGGKPAVSAFFKALADVVPFSPTLADARTTLSYPTGTSHKFMTAAEREAYGIRDGLVRLSVGLEEPGDIERELVGALAKL